MDNKYAYLISAYTEPDTLVHLVNSLDNNADFFIHIDKKTDLKKFQEPLLGKKNVYFVKDRVKVFWGGYSQVILQQKLIKEMLNTNREYKKVINLSGTDYPVYSNDVLHFAFDRDVEYIMGFDVIHEEGHGKNKEKMITKFSRYHHMDTNKYVRAFF